MNAYFWIVLFSYYRELVDNGYIEVHDEEGARNVPGANNNIHGENSASNAPPSAAALSGNTGTNFATKPQGGPSSDQIRIMEWVSEILDTGKNK